MRFNVDTFLMGVAAVVAVAVLVAAFNVATMKDIPPLPMQKPAVESQ